MPGGAFRMTANAFDKETVRFLNAPELGRVGKGDSQIAA
jgi:hypothetical protein